MLIVSGFCCHFSYFSPLLKSITTQADVDYFTIEEDLDERDAFIATLESRFFFLAADARSTIRLLKLITKLLNTVSMSSKNKNALL